MATYTAHGGVYLRDIDLPASFDSASAYHDIILDYLQTEGVPDFQLRRLNSDELCYTCPQTRKDKIVAKDMSDVPDHAVLYYKHYAPAEARSLALPPMGTAESSRLMLVTRDPLYLHLYFSGHRMSIPFPVAKSDFEMVGYAVDTLRDMGVSYLEDPVVAMVACESDQLSPRLLYNGRRSLHDHCLELIGLWEAIPRRMDAFPMPPTLDVRCAARDALVPRVA